MKEQEQLENRDKEQNVTDEEYNFVDVYWGHFSYGNIDVYGRDEV